MRVSVKLIEEISALIFLLFTNTDKTLYKNYMDFKIPAVKRSSKYCSIKLCQSK